MGGCCDDKICFVDWFFHGLFLVKAISLSVGLIVKWLSVLLIGYD